jgi:hypothetical protein
MHSVVAQLPPPDWQQEALEREAQLAAEHDDTK